MRPTLVEAAAGDFNSSLGDGEPHHGVGALLRGSQAVLHGPVEVWHGVGHSCAHTHTRLEMAGGGLMPGVNRGRFLFNGVLKRLCC